MKLLLLIPATSGLVLFSICGKTESDKLRAYQHMLTILLSNSSDIYRTYGTGLLGLLQGSNNRSSMIYDVANIACVTAVRSLSLELRALVADVSVQVSELDQVACALIILMTFTDGDTIRKEFI